MLRGGGRNGHRAVGAGSGERKACHGEQGAKPTTPDYPLLAGQHEDYIKHTLAAYKSKKRINVIMNAMAAALSKQDIADIAAYLSHQEGLKVKY